MLRNAASLKDWVDYPADLIIETRAGFCSKIRTKPSEDFCGALFRGLRRIDEIHVHALISHVGSDMRGHIPIEIGRQLLAGGRQVLAKVGRIENLTLADFP